MTSDPEESPLEKVRTASCLSQGSAPELSDPMLSDVESDGDVDWEPTLPPEDNEPPPPPPDDDEDPRTPPPSPPESDDERWGDGEGACDGEAGTASVGTEGTETGTGTEGTERSDGMLSDDDGDDDGDDGEGSEESDGDSDSDVDIRMKVTPEGVKPVVVPASVFRKRRQIAMEIVDTEKTYVNQLTIMVQLFVIPLQRKEFDMSQSDIVTLFSNIEVLRNLHSKMLEQLQPRVVDWQDSSCIGDVFFENSKWIKLYKHYVNNYDTARDFLATLRKKNAKMRKYLKEVEFTPQMAHLNLEALLVVPVQRVPRYVLLLRDLLRNTPETHADYVPLEGALKLIEEVATYINVHKAMSDALRTLADTKARISNLPFDIVVPNRELLREAIFVVNKERRKLFVFSDLIIVASAETRHGQHRYKGHITLSTAAVQREDGLVLTLVSPEGINKIQLTGLSEYEDWARFLELTLMNARGDLLRTAFTDVSQSSEGCEVFVEQQQQRYAEARCDVMKRLVHSEREYVDSLQVIIDYFIRPLHEQLDESPQMLAQRDAQRMCSNIEQLYDMHAGFAQDLEDRLKTWDDRAVVTDLFQDKLSDFRMYVHYVSYHSEQVAVLEHNLGNNGLFANWFYKSTSIKDFSNLKCWFEIPLRRISEYYLFLQEMENNTSKKDLEYAPLHQVVLKLGILKDDLTRKSAESKHQALIGARQSSSQRVHKW